jgi:hypothetical protein
MRPVKYVLFLLTAASCLHAQHFSHPVSVSRDDALSLPRSPRFIPDTVSVLAVMVQFQADDDPRTSGNGRFDLSAPADSIIDAPPRNRQYFADHLTFAENYFRKASKGRLILRSTVVDSIFTLPTVMATYSPPRDGGNVEVADLARDTWQLVDASGLVPDFSRFDCFIVFHAGVGRDVDLVSLLGFDPTPLDIPSLFFGLNGFKSVYGQNFNGFSVNNGAFRITNTAVLPETENRVITGLAGNVLIELGINGLLCASIGSYLGLPDLFDTQTGRSAIGRFGLMDGQSIFSFSGVFPPEPSAWEKYWLGWVEPITLHAGVHDIRLPAVALADTIYRVPISAQEYFLVENRNRDPLRTGQTITSVFNGVTRAQTFARDTAGFNAFDIRALAGVITDVSNPDWSLPGGVSQDGEFFDGGILIWHIDEVVIARGLATNGVNADPLRRGVDLEEADGSQDIGQEYGFLDPGSGSESGTALDFWFAGNPAPVNRNEFSPTSLPDSRSNTGANSHITISDFSARGAVMMARVLVGSDQVSLLPTFPRTFGEFLTTPALTVGNARGTNEPHLLVTTTGVQIPPLQGGGSTSALGKIYALKSNGDGVTSSSQNGLFATTVSIDTGFVGPVSLKDLDGDDVLDVVVSVRHGVTSGIKAYSAQFLTPDSLARAFLGIAVSGRIPVNPVISDSVIACGGAVVYFFRHDGSVIDSLVPGGSANGIALFRNPDRFVVTSAGGDVYLVTLRLGANAAIESVASVSIPGKIIIDPPVVGNLGRNTERMIAFTTMDGFLYLLNEDLQPAPGFPVAAARTGESALLPPALADVDGDGFRDIIVFVRNRIHVYNYSGASLENFPKQIPTSFFIRSNPVIADMDGDGNVDIVAVAEDGLVVAYDKNGKLVRGFPLLAGTGEQSVAAFAIPTQQPSVTDIGLAVASSETGSLTAWKTGSTSGNHMPAMPWPQYQKDAQHTGLAVEPTAGLPLSNDFFPRSRAYNWPNPVYDGRTFIRYFVKEDASVNVKVYDLAGDLVTEFHGPGIGGVDNEVAWDVSGVQSGIYFARIEASGSAGNGVAVVKVAVVK